MDTEQLTNSLHTTARLDLFSPPGWVSPPVHDMKCMYHPSSLAFERTDLINQKRGGG